MSAPLFALILCSLGREAPEGIVLQIEEREPRVISAVAAVGNGTDGSVGIPNLGWFRVTNGRCHGSGEHILGKQLFTALQSDCAVTIAPDRVCFQEATFSDAISGRTAALSGCAAITGQRAGPVKEDWKAPPPPAPPPVSSVGLVILQPYNDRLVSYGRERFPLEPTCALACPPPDAAVTRFSYADEERDPKAVRKYTDAGVRNLSTAQARRVLPPEKGFFIFLEHGGLAYCFDSDLVHPGHRRFEFETDEGRLYGAAFGSTELRFVNQGRQVYPTGCKTKCCTEQKPNWLKIGRRLRDLNTKIYSDRLHGSTTTRCDEGDAVPN